MEKIIKAAVKKGASDLHMKAGDVFRARVDGKLVPLTKQRLTPDQTRAIALKLLPTERLRSQIDELCDYDCSWGMAGVGRFRVNIMRQRSSFMVVMRVIPFEIPTLTDLEAPEGLASLVESDQGLLLIAGKSGSGRSSTVAGLIDHVNRSQHRHIITIENPIEFLHRDLRCSVTQREVGIDTDTVSSGLQSAMRQDPDVIVLSDLPGPETIEAAVQAAESGLLVVASIGASDVVAAIERLLSPFSGQDRDIMQVRLAEVLAGVAAQQLLPGADGDGRVAVFELLAGTPDARKAIKDGKFESLAGLMEAEDEETMTTFANELARLVEDGAISKEVAQAAGLPTTGRTTRRRTKSSRSRS